jgi:hypothetical protein
MFTPALKHSGTDNKIFVEQNGISIAVLPVVTQNVNSFNGKMVSCNV